MATVTIDGRMFSGHRVAIINGKVMIDGVAQDGSLTGVVEIRIIEGVLQELNTDAAVSCGEVRGSVRAGGSVNCDGVGGNVSAGGSVNCGDVRGNVVAGGSIRHG